MVLENPEGMTVLDGDILENGNKGLSFFGIWETNRNHMALGVCNFEAKNLHFLGCV